MNSDNYITTKEVAQRLNKSISTIYRYVNEKKLRPVYEDKWQIDFSLLFREEDVERLIEEQQNKPGYTTGEVAAKLSKHPSTIAMYIKTGKLKTEKRQYKGRIINFISEQEVERLQKEIGEKESGYQNIYDKQHAIHLYQSFQDSKGNKARVMSLDNSIVIELEDGSRIGIEKLYQLNYMPVFDVRPQRYVTKKGYLHFQFREPIHSKSTQLDIIESLIISMGEKNVKIRAEERGLSVFVKPGLIKTHQTFHLTLELLNAHLNSGNIIQRHDGILLQTDYTQLISHVHKDVRYKLKNMAHSKDMTLDDYIEGILTKHVNESKD